MEGKKRSERRRWKETERGGKWMIAESREQRAGSRGGARQGEAQPYGDVVRRKIEGTQREGLTGMRGLTSKRASLDRVMLTNALE
jgi:hypothetical protein